MSQHKAALARLVKGAGKEDERITKFKSAIILHRNFEQAILEVSERLEYGGRQAITAVVGPTGAGKTALATEMTFQFERASMSMSIDDRQRLLYWELPARGSGVFNWKVDFYQPVLKLLGEPCADAKIDVDRLREARFDGRDVWKANGEPSVAKYREMLLEAFDRCRVMGLLIDEAHHFKRSTVKAGALFQYDTIKSCSNSTDTHFVLFGTAAVTDIWYQSGQISRRTYPVWVHPYYIHELEFFIAAVDSIIESLPIKPAFELAPRYMDIFEASFGLIGVVHEWFERALVKCIANHRSRMTWSDFWELQLHDAQLSAVLDDLITFKKFHRECAAVKSQKKSFLFGSEDKTDVPNEKPAIKPGERRPHRDPVPS